MYILIGADLVPTKNNTELFVAGNTEELLGKDLKTVLEKAEFRIFNLEIPLTDQESPIIKQGPNLIAPADTINGYKAIGADLLTLANNHILDQDVQGLDSTVELLDRSGVKHLGAGKDLDSARKPFIFDFGNKKIGIYACAEHEFSIAEENMPGANPFDPLYSFDHVEELKRISDYVIILYHGGKEHYRYPSPDLQKICRRFVEKGAALVICQHSHCIGCEERYKNGIIVYGQGNFIFNKSDNEFWRTSLLVKIEDDLSVSYIPLVKTENGTCLADDKTGEEILGGFRRRTEQIKDPAFVEKAYSDFAEQNLSFYLSALSGKKSIVFRALNRLSKGRLLKKAMEKRYRKAENVRIINYLECEAHRELMLRAVKTNISGQSQSRENDIAAWLFRFIC